MQCSLCRGSRLMYLTLSDECHPLSVNRVLKHLKREENGLYNCVHSIAADTAFVREIAEIHKQLPLYANLRCGLWYTPEAHLTCYFKSTDGHYGNWNFSLTRLNWHLALAAASCGGCVIVDATRRGKTFSDALSKTIPIWAAVLNIAVYRHRLAKASRYRTEATRTRDGATFSDRPSGSTASPKPLTINTESPGIGSTDEGRQEGVAQSTEQPQTSETVWDCSLHLPLWISQNEESQIQGHLDSWVENLLQTTPGLEELAAALSKPLRPLWVSQHSRIWVNDMPNPAELSFTPLILVSASQPNARHRQSCLIGHSERAFTYVPGAGDDEESWARGLTPKLFWQHHKVVLNADEEEIAEVVNKLVHASTALPLMREESASNLNVLPIRDVHHPAVQGVALEALETHIDPTMPCEIGASGMFLGDFQAGMPPRVWKHVDAVLNVGRHQHPSMECAPEGAYMWLPIQPAKLSRQSLESSLPVAVSFLSGQLSAGKRVLVHCMEGWDQSLCIVLALLLCCFEEAEPGRWSKFKLPFISLPPNLSKEEVADERHFENSHEVASQPSSQILPEDRSSSGQKHLTGRNKLYWEARNEADERPSASKSAVRRCLAFVSSFYPVACPSRGSLRQVYNFLRLHAPVQEPSVSTM